MKFNPRIASAVAAAVAMAVSAGTAHAVSLASTPYVFSQQGQALSNLTSAQGLPAFTATLGADYSLNDTVNLTIAGATVGGATDTNLVAASAIQCPAGGPDAVILSFVARTGNTIQLRITQKNVANTVGVVCTFAADKIEVTRASLTSVTSITASWDAITALSNIHFDPKTVPAGAFALANVVDQFNTNGLVALDGVIDVNSPSLRKNFLTDDGVGITAPAAPANRDNLSLVTNDGAGVAAFTGPVARLTNVVATVTGSVGFTHLDANSNGSCSNAEVNAAASQGNTGAAASGALTGPVSGCASVVYTYTAPGGVLPANGNSFTHSLSFGTTGAELRAQTFSAGVTYNYGCDPGFCGTATGSETDNVAVGAWKLNGFQAFVPYMPFGATISQILYVTNKSTQAGAVTVDAYNEAGAACSFSGGTAAANSVTQLSTALVNGITNCYGVGYTGKVSFNVSAPIPGALAEVYSAYNVNGNRLTVVNNSNGKTVTGGNTTLGNGL